MHRRQVIISPPPSPPDHAQEPAPRHNFFVLPSPKRVQERGAIPVPPVSEERKRKKKRPSVLQGPQVRETERKQKKLLQYPPLYRFCHSCCTGRKQTYTHPAMLLQWPISPKAIQSINRKATCREAVKRVGGGRPRCSDVDSSTPETRPGPSMHVGRSPDLPVSPL